MASNQDGSLIMTGSVDCHAKLVNSATGKVGQCGWGQSQEPWGTSLPSPVLGQAGVSGWFGLLLALSSLCGPLTTSRRHPWPIQLLRAAGGTCSWVVPLGW